VEATFGIVAVGMYQVNGGVDWLWSQPELTPLRGYIITVGLDCAVNVPNTAGDAFYLGEVTLGELLWWGIPH